jgi:hypothetical protein
LQVEQFPTGARRSVRRPKPKQLHPPSKWRRHKREHCQTDQDRGREDERVVLVQQPPDHGRSSTAWISRLNVPSAPLVHPLSIFLTGGGGYVGRRSFFGFGA